MSRREVVGAVFFDCQSQARIMVVVGSKLAETDNSSRGITRVLKTTINNQEKLKYCTLEFVSVVI